MDNKLHQHDLIMNYLKNHKSISPAQAFDLLGVMKLSTRIGELREKGIPIIKKREKGFNRFGHRITYMTYSLGEEDGKQG